MARVKLSEYDAKRLIYSSLNLHFSGLQATRKTTATEIKSVFPGENLVVKVDQGVKKRGKQGLVKVNLTPSEIPSIIAEWSRRGWSQFLIEPVVEHSEDAEKYLALERSREGWRVSYSAQGGVDIESNWSSVQTKIFRREMSSLQTTDGEKVAPAKETSEASVYPAASGAGATLMEFLPPLLHRLDELHISFLECNPVLVRKGLLFPLDMAAEIDSAALALAELSGHGINAIEDRAQSAPEQKIAELDASTPASLKFRLINPTGSIWMLLSGGGASLVLADEVADAGLGPELANYGEYSGAPTDDDVYSYTKIIIENMLSSPRKGKIALIIAGGVANFTDVGKTFKGLIRALDEKQGDLHTHKVKVFVRRGGPNEEKGLGMMRSFLNKSDLLGSVYGHKTPLIQVVVDAKTYLAARKRRTL